MKQKTKLFSLAKDAFTWQYYRGSGDGGQKKQKTSSACRCTHEESGAVGTSQDHREQSQNRKLAFERCTNSKEFQAWLELKIADETDKLQYEKKDRNGNWVKCSKYELED